MKIDIKEIPKSQMEITIELSIDQFKPFVEQAVNKLSQKTNIQGFRPGKVPYDVLKKNIDEMEILKEAAEIAVPKTYPEAVKEKNLEIVSQPNIEIVKLAPDNPFIYKATVTLLPDVEICDYQEIKVEKKPVTVTDEKTNATLNELSMMHAQTIPKEGPCVNDDKIEIDFDISRDGVAIEHGAYKNFTLVLGEQKMIPDFEENLVGLKKGAEKTFKLTFPDTYHQKSLSGKECQFKVKVQNIFTVEKPAIDEEFAKKLKFKDVADLKTQLSANLQREAEAEQERHTEKEVLDQLVDKSKFNEVPESLVNQEIETMINELTTNVQRQGMSFDDYLKSIKKTLGELKLELSSGALRRVKAGVLLARIAKKEKIVADPKEIDQEVEKIKQFSQQGPQVQGKEWIGSPAHRSYLENTIVNRKTIEFLKSIAIKEKS